MPSSDAPTRRRATTRRELIEVAGAIVVSLLFRLPWLIRRTEQSPDSAPKSTSPR